MTKLEPCPFCGSYNIRSAHLGIYYAECKDCGAFGPDIKYESIINKDILIEIANKLWNERK